MSPLRRFLTIWLGGLGLAALLGFAFLTPISFSLNWVDRVPGLSRLYCPESGQIAPRYFQSRSSKNKRPIACLDAKGVRIEDWNAHFRMVWSVGAFWTVILFWPFRALATALFDGKNTGRRSRMRR